ncbi:hypothetical protein KCG44_08025 [Pacificimonas sp. WHA3]|uniref:EF-hand domain-containing protein n=1 Tax=Pacificimonas pallii TaxID=2827236 RepID=A0ABS6SE89_9SPHN|nr:hypothetical protein [Pacificimonas pallii]MBV7256732.1 hypothetical protein [Pacificimonas pallii]
MAHPDGKGRVMTLRTILVLTAILALIALAAFALMREADAPADFAAAPPPVVPGPAAPASCPAVPQCRVAAPPEPAPKADPVLREQRRFARSDKDRDGVVAKAEYLQSRQKSFDRMDSNGDGVIDFIEYSVKQRARFDASDCDATETLTPGEFESTATRKDAPEPDC